MRGQRTTPSDAPTRCYATSGAGVGSPLTVEDVALLTRVLRFVYDGGEHYVLQILAGTLDQLRVDLADNVPDDLRTALDAWGRRLDYGYDPTRAMEWRRRKVQRRVVEWIEAELPGLGDVVRSLFGHLASWEARCSTGPHRPALPFDEHDNHRLRPARRDRLRLRTLQRIAWRTALSDMAAAGPPSLNRAERRAVLYGHTPEPSAPAWEHVEPLPPPDPLTQPRAAQAPPRTAWALAA